MWIKHPGLSREARTLYAARQLGNTIHGMGTDLMSAMVMASVNEQHV